MDADADLVEVVAAAMVAHDPLDPWLVQSGWDEHFWDDEAAVVASVARSASRRDEVFDAVVRVFRPYVRDPVVDDYVRARLDRITTAVWDHLHA